MQRDPNNKLTVLSLWRQFIPLSISDVTMALGDPAITTTLAHLPDARLNLAAVGIAKSIAVFFESPIIMVLHASNALSPSKKSRSALWRFTLISTGLITLLFSIILLPGIFQFISDSILGIDGSLATRSRDVLLCLLLWPAVIAWRRFFQGILIHYGHANAIAHAGFGRLLLVLSVLGAGYVGRIHGYLLAGIALIGGVIFEAIIVTVVAKGKKGLLFHDSQVKANLPNDLMSVWKYYWPLANSMLVVWGGRALLLSIIARANDASIALAVWPTAWSLVLVIGNATRMVQQVIIKNRHCASLDLLFRFTMSVGFAFFLILFGLATTSIGADLVSTFIGGDPMLLAGVINVLLICSSIPFLLVIQNALQGFLVSEGRTDQINRAAWIGTLVLLSGSVMCIYLGISGAKTAAINMVSAIMVEMLYLLVVFKEKIYNREAHSLIHSSMSKTCVSKASSINSSLMAKDGD